MFLRKPDNHGAALRAVCFGVLFAMAFLYLVVYIPEIMAGTHTLDLNLIRGLAVVGIATIGFGYWENRHL